jgi:hypothetical protein
MQRSETEDNQVVEKLDIAIRLLAHNVAMQHETLESKAVALTAAGLKPAEIAKICGTTPLTISVRLAEAKRRARRKGGNRGHKEH